MKMMWCLVAKQDQNINGAQQGSMHETKLSATDSSCEHQPAISRHVLHLKKFFKLRMAMLGHALHTSTLQ